jgi:hypothetical protein
MRRITLLGAVVLGSTVLAAMGLAQSGFRGQREATSLVDRLTALRQSMANSAPTGESPAMTNETPSEANYGQRTERSVLAARGAALGPQRQPGPRETPAEPATQDRPRRPRLLSHLDPFNLLSTGDEEETPPARSIETEQRTAQPFRESTEIRRNPMPIRSSQTIPAPVTQPTAPQTPPAVERPIGVRRSPLAERPQESLPSSTSPLQEAPTGIALGPSDSQNLTLPSLDRPTTELLPNTVSPQPLPAREPEPSEPPGDESPQASASDAWNQSSSRYAIRPQEEGTTPRLSPSRDALPNGGNPEANVAPVDAGSGDAVGPIPAEGNTADDNPGIEPYRAEAGATGSPTPAQSHSGTPAASQQSPDFPSPQASAADAVRGEEVLSSDEAPAVAWEVTGPRKVIIGRNATFEIKLKNSGDDPAQRLVARIEVPGSADIVSADSSHGVGQRIEDGDGSSVLEWRIDQLTTQRDAELQLTVVPRTNQMMSLQVSVRSEPRAAVAQVEVLEPKLRLALEGPADLLHGEPRTFRLTVSNPGTGPAENVVVLFTPPGAAERSAERHNVGLLGAGEAKTIDLEITPQEAGDVTMKAVASADGDLRDLAERRVLIRKPELVVDVRGPRSTYAGTVATYYCRVQNTGDATADDVIVQTRLPMDAEFVRAADDRKIEPVANKESVTWKVGSLPAGGEVFMELKCKVNRAGDNLLEVAAHSAKRDLNESKSITTHVVALADLKLEVSDPQGPVAVGKEAVYEVRIKNRGSNTAEQINVAALFSEGIDPVGVEGGQHSIDNGRVAFRMIESLPAGREILFKIRAVASQPGTHVFRAEVLCRELETKLAAEETTRFYEDDTTATRGDGTVQAAVHADMFETE